MEFNYNTNALSMTGLIPVSTDQAVINNQVYLNKTEIELAQLEIATLDIRVSQNETDIDSLETNVAQNTADITAIEAELDLYNFAQIGINTTNIALLNTELDALTIVVGTNTTNIATNTSNISTNTSNISTNTSNIATNTAKIAINTAKISTNTSYINTNITNIATNTANIATNTSNIATNTANIATNTSNISTNTSNIATNTSNIATNTSNISSLTSQVNTNTSNITQNTIDIADINVDINEIRYLEKITNINTHGNQYGENGEIYATNGFDTIDYSLTQINLPVTTYFFTTSFPNGGSLKIYEVQTPSANNQIVKYRFQIPVCVKANGSCTTAVNDVNLSYAIPTQFYAIKNGDVFNPIVGSITSHTGGNHIPKRFNTITTGAWSFEVYLYTLFIEFSPPASNPNDLYEIYVDITFNCYSLGTANPQRLCSLTRAGYNLNTSMELPYYTYSNLVPTTTIEEDGFVVQGFNSVVLNPQIATNTASIASLQTQVTNLSNYVYNSLVPAVYALQTGLVNFVNSNVYIMPCLYPEIANVNFTRLFVQQFLNVATFDPMNSFTCPYIFSYSHFVLCCDNTAFQPAYCRIEIKVSSNNGANIWAYIGKEYINFQFQNVSNVISMPTISWAEVPIGTQLNFDIEFFSNSGSTPLVFGPEYIIYPYCNRRPFFQI